MPIMPSSSLSLPCLFCVIYICARLMVFFATWWPFSNRFAHSPLTPPKWHRGVLGSVKPSYIMFSVPISTCSRQTGMWTINGRWFHEALCTMQFVRFRMIMHGWVSSPTMTWCMRRSRNVLLETRQPSFPFGAVGSGNFFFGDHFSSLQKYLVCGFSTCRCPNIADPFRTILVHFLQLFEFCYSFFVSFFSNHSMFSPFSSSCFLLYFCTSRFCPKCISSIVMIFWMVIALKTAVVLGCKNKAGRWTLVHAVFLHTHVMLVLMFVCVRVASGWSVLFPLTLTKSNRMARFGLVPTFTVMCIP